MIRRRMWTLCCDRSKMSAAQRRRGSAADKRPASPSSSLGRSANRDAVLVRRNHLVQIPLIRLLGLGKQCYHVQNAAYHARSNEYFRPLPGIDELLL